MAGNNVDLNVRVKGADKAKQELSGLAQAVDREAEALRKKSLKKQAQDILGTSQGFGSAFKDSAFGNISSVAIGTALGNAIPQALGAANRSIAQAFDPNLSPVEKQLNVAKAALDLIPFEGGAIPKALLEAETQEIVGGAKGTGSRINSLLGPAFQASANLSDEDFEARFKPIIERLRGIIEPQERSRERGSQLIAESLASFLDEFTKKQSELAPQSSEKLKEYNEEQKRQTAQLEEIKNILASMVVGGPAGTALALAGKVN